MLPSACQLLQIMREENTTMFDTLPPLPATAESFGTWSWAQMAPYDDDLLSRQLSAASVDEWLADWTRIAALAEEALTRFTIRTTTNTADALAQREYTPFLEEILPQVLEAEQQVKGKLLESGLAPTGFELPLRKLRADAALYREMNVPLLAEERKLSLAYQIRRVSAPDFSHGGETRPGDAVDNVRSMGEQ